MKHGAPPDPFRPGPPDEAPPTITVRRDGFGLYSAFGKEADDRASWDATMRRVASDDFHPRASEQFKRALRELDLGYACGSCGYLEVEHHIDGPERATRIDGRLCDGWRRRWPRSVSR